MRIKGILTKNTLLTFLVISLFLAYNDEKTYCATKKDEIPDLTLVYSSDINGYYKPCG